MKKFMSFLLSAALMMGAAACGDDDNDSSKGPDKTDPDKFSCVIAVTQGEDTADVTVTPNNTTAAYKVWVTEQAGYKEEIPADAVEATGKTTKQFTGLKPDTEYYAVVYEETMGYKTKEFLTDEATVVYESLQGTSYYPIALDAKTLEKISDKVVTDLACDDLTTFFDWWNAPAFGVGVCSGPNSFGEVEGWFSLTINAGAGWFGGAIRLINPTPADIAAPNPDGTMPEGKVSQEAADKAKQRRDALKQVTTDYTLRLAMKSNAGGNYNFGMFEGNTVTIGDENAPYGFARDGEWHEIEIPMSVFMSGENFNFDNVNVIYFTQAADGPFPANLDFDGVFIYKKNK